MPVLRGSRYEGVRFTAILGEDSKVRKFLHAREPLDPATVLNPFVVHLVQRGDELDAITHRAVGKPRLWWVLGDVNNVLFPLAVDIDSADPGIKPGTELVVPLRELRDRQEFGG